MAAPVLNPEIAQLNQSSRLYALYMRFYGGMVAANGVDSPDFTPTEQEILPSGELTQAFYTRVQEGLAEYSDIQMKNSAYNMAAAILDETGGTGGFVLRAGDSMEGLLQALYGFEAGLDGTMVLEIAEDEDEELFVNVEGYVAADFFLVKSDTYETKLQENELFFNDGASIKGVDDGILFVGNLSSRLFEEGVDGYGWAIRGDNENGWEATFDTLVVRRGSHIHELEARKIRNVNTELWVSDDCMGDTVEEIV